MLQNDFFNNRQKKGFDELVSYQPKYYHNILEMQAINQFGGLTTDRMADDLNQLILDQFIDSCSVKMLSRFEMFLNITGNENRSIQERRNIVKVAWIGNIKMNRSKIKTLIRAYCGCESDVHFSHEIVIIIKILESDCTVYNLKDLIDVFKSQIPSHLQWKVELRVDKFLIKEVNPVSVLKIRFYTELKGVLPRNYDRVKIALNMESMNNHLDCVIVKKKNIWYLNGEQKLDGSKYLNAIEEKEEM